jgi:uncharacterized protein YdeI (BOF family)
MKKFLLRFSFAALATVLALALTPSLHAQQADQDNTQATPQQATPAATQQPQQNQAQMPSSGDTTTQEANAFAGRIVKENGDLVLKDPVSNVSYKLSDPAKAQPFVGKQVKVTGKLDVNSNTIAVEKIELP